MNPLLLSGFGITIDVNNAHLTIKQKDTKIDFEPHRIPYDSLIVEGHYGSISFEAMRWLSKHDVSISLINWNGNMLYTAMPKETLNADLKIKQYEKYLNPETRLYISGQIVKQKVKSSVNLIKELSNFYDIDLTTINREIERIDYDNVKSLMMYEGRIAAAYWSCLSEIFKELAPDFNFQSRKNLSYSWNMNASDPVNAMLNYGYAILESLVRKTVNSIGLDPSIGFLHEIEPSKHPLVYDLQELFRYVVDYSVIELLETRLKKSDFIVTENYHIRLKPDTAKKLIEKIKENFSRRYEFKNKQYALDNILFENVRILSKCLLEKSGKLEFNIPELKIVRVDNKDVRSRIMSIDPDKRKALGINKSTLWYQQKKIKEGKEIKVYSKTRGKLIE